MSTILQPAPRDFVKLIRSRSASLGITTADTFLREFVDCLDGRCPSNILKNVSPQGWQRMMKRASRTVVYDGRGLEFGETVRVKEGMTGDTELPPRTIATVPVIVTTPTRDRDGDILETAGADFDLKSPHLFNHLSSEVVGTTIKQLAHTKKVLKALLSFMDTQFAENVAVMYEHGSLRTSHGFLPEEWEPLDDGQGFHILKFKILEVSGVSIPSNPDAGPAGAMEFSRRKLTHPLLKEWGRMKFRGRRKMAPVGISLRDLPPNGVVITPVKAQPEACGCHVEAKKVVPYSATKKADKDKPWDGDAAVKRLRSWAGVDVDEPTDAAWKKYAKGFARVNGDGTKFGDFQLPHHDVDGGELVVVWKGVVAARAAAKGARGGMDLGDDAAGVIAHLDKHYKQFGEEPPDEGKSASLETKGVYVEFENSWDDIRCDLSDSLLPFLMASGVADYDDLAYIVDMFPERAIVCLCEGVNRFYGPCEIGPIGYDDDRCHYFVCTWAMNGEEPEWTGTPQEVEITPNIQPAAERALRAMSEKAFLKDSHVKKLAKAMDHLDEANGHEDATAATKSLDRKAHGAIKSVHDAHEKGVLTGTHRKKLEKAMGYCSEGAEHEDATAPITNAFKAAHKLVKDVMDSAGDMGETAAPEAEQTAPEPEEKTVEAETKGLTLGPEHQRKVKSAAYHFKAIEHHDDAGNEHQELARKAYTPLQDMLNQVDSDPADEDYEEGRGEPAEAKAAKIGKANVDKINTAIEHGETLSKHKSATPHIKSMAKHAVAHLKAIVKPSDPAGEAGENGAEGTEGENGNPPKGLEATPKSFNERCGEMLDEAIDLIPDDDALITLAATGSKAGKLLRRRQADAAKQ